jgi:hypothetical protein
MRQLVVIAITSIAITAGYVLVVNNVFGSTELLTYENPNYNVRIGYPTTWKTEEINLDPHQVVRILPNEFAEEYESPVRFYITVGSGSSSPLDLSQAIAAFEGLTKNSSDARFINSTNTTLSGLPAFSISYYDYTMGHNYKVTDTMAFLDDELFHLQYYAEPGYFNQHLPEAKKMIDSFEITKNSSSNSKVPSQ